MISKTRRDVKWLALLTFSVVFVLTGTLFVRNWNDLVTFPWRLNLGYLILTLLFHSLALGMTFLVWRLMVIRLSGFSDLGMNFRFYYLSALAKRVPVSIWYIGGRLVMYKQVGVSGPSIMNAILLENSIIGLASILAFLTFLPLSSIVPDGVTWLITGIGVLLIILFLVRPQISIELTNLVLRRFHRRELDKIPARRDILLWGGYYLVTILFAGMSIYYATRAFSDDIGPGLVDSIGIASLTTLVALMSIVLPGGFGLKELTAGALLSRWMPLPAAIVISIIYRLLQTLNEAVWATGAYFLPAKPNITHAALKQSERIIDE